MSAAITDVQCLDELVECLAENLPIKTQGSYNERTVYETLIKAASEADM